ncbi:MAG: ABC transporter permease [Spirochaetales bacterium]|nr:ABC transporter permease [Spirochaetales bacterium]
MKHGPRGGKGSLFLPLCSAASVVILLFILVPIVLLMTSPDPDVLVKTIGDPDVLRAIGLSMRTAGLATLIAFAFGTPLAYLLAHRDFPGKHLVESLVDLPLVIPHPVIGIAILAVAGRASPVGRFLQALGVQVMGTVTGIVAVLLFVGLPLYVNSAKNGFEAVPRRLEYVARNLGAGPFGAFRRVTFPLAWRSVLVGMVLCFARAVSEFGAVVVVAYHPMIAPVLLFERYEAYGLKYSQPVAFWLILISLSLFFTLRTLMLRGKANPASGRRP